MGREEVFTEAELILAEFQEFWAVDENIYHLYGIVQKTGVQQYTVDVIFPATFPSGTPQIKVSKEIFDLLGKKLELKTLTNWKPGVSHVVDVLRELKNNIDKNLEKDYLDLKMAPKDMRAKDYSEFATPEPFEFRATEKGLDIKAVSRPPPSVTMVHERKAPEQPAPARVQDDVLIPENKKWDKNMQGIQAQEGHDYWERADEPVIREIEEQQATTGNARLDGMLREQLDAIMMEYGIDHVKLGQASVYVPISVENTFLIFVNFLDYPAKPHFQVDPIIKELVGEPDAVLDTLKKWNPKDSPMVVDAVRELEGKLWSLHDIEAKLKAIFGEFETIYLPESRTAVRVTILTYGFREYQVTIDLKGYPGMPSVQYSQNLATLIRTSPDNLKVIQNWENSDKEPVAIVREINWLIDKESRMSFEIDLLRNNLKDVQYDPLSKTVTATLKGTMKTQEQSFQFKVSLSENYPMTAPTVNMGELDDEEMEEKMKAGLQAILGKWFPSSSYLIDVFNAISKSIFEVSVVSCILCHKLDCPTCHEKMDTQDPMEVTCKVVCPYCERTYHRHCWEQTIATFGKCGFCLRPPPPELMPN